MKIKIEVQDFPSSYTAMLRLARKIVSHEAGVVLRAAPGKDEVVIDHDWIEVRETVRGFAYEITLPNHVDWDWYGEQIETITESPTAELAQSPTGWVQPITASMVTIEV